MSDDSLQQPSPLKEVPTVYSDSTVPVEADHAQLVALLNRATGALVDAGSVPTEDLEQGIRALAQERDQLVALVKALPKVEGEINVFDCTVSITPPGDWPDSIVMRSPNEAKAYKALLDEARRGMEG